MVRQKLFPLPWREEIKGRGDDLDLPNPFLKRGLIKEIRNFTSGKTGLLVIPGAAQEVYLSKVIVGEHHGICI